MLTLKVGSQNRAAATESISNKPVLCTHTKTIIYGKWFCFDLIFQSTTDYKSSSTLPFTVPEMNDTQV